MTDANRAEVLPRFFHCSKQEAREVAVEIAPAAAEQTTPCPPRTSVDPVTSDLRRIHLTVSKDFLALLK